MRMASLGSGECLSTSSSPSLALVLNRVRAVT